VIESGSTLKLYQRGILVSVEAFSDLDVRGKFRFSGNSDDRLVVSTRSSGTYLSNPYNDLDNGITFIFQRPIDSIEIGAYSYPGVSTQLAIGTAPLPLNTWIDFRVRDDGFHLELYVHDLDTPALTATSSLSFGQRLAFSNREYTSCQTEIDYVDVRRVWKKNPSNGHWYMGMGLKTWADAEQMAVSLGGHLPTVRSSAENDWLRDNFAAVTNAGVWIGLNDLATEGSYTWTSGEPITFTSWDSGEPNNANGNEDVVHIRSLGDGGTFGHWNDDAAVNVRAGVVEVVSGDCDGDRVPDVTELLTDPSSDLNGNGLLDQCECGVHNACVSEPNSSGAAARMSLAGLPSISLDSFTLLCGGCPPFTTGIFYYGTQPNQVPFGNGYRCVGGMLVRTPITVASATGVAARTLSLSTSPHSLNLTVGSVRHFQFWFRDVAGGGALFDLSDSLSIQFCP